MLPTNLYDDNVCHETTDICPTLKVN